MNNTFSSHQVHAI